MEDYETYTISQIRATWKRHFSTEQRDARTRLIGSKEAIFLKEVKKINNNVNPSRPNLGQREKIKLNFYFHTSLWYLKRFCEGLKDLHKTFWGTAKKCESKNLT